MKPTGTAAAWIVSSSAAIAVLTVLVKALGYVEKRVQAHYFGTRDDIECFVVALRLSLVLYFVLRGVLRPAVVPLLLSAKDSAPGGALRFGYSLSIPVFFFLALCAAGGIVFAPELAAVFVTGFAPEKQAYCAGLLRWLLPGVVFMTAAYLLTLSLQVQKRFAWSAAGECLQKVVFVMGIIALAAPLGFRWILTAHWLSVLALCGFLGFLHAKPIRGFDRLTPSWMPLRQTLWLAWPLLIGSFASQFGRLAQNWFASTLLPGSIVSLTYAQAIVDLPLMLVPLSLSVVMFVYFSEFADRKETHASTAYLAGAVRYLLLVFLPLALAAVTLRQPLTALLFRGGQFKAESVILTAEALAGLAPGLPFFALEAVLMTFFFAHRRIGLAVGCGIASTVFAAACLPVLADRYSLSGVAAYLTLQRVFKLWLLVRCLGFLGIAVPWTRAMAFLAKTAIATGLAAGAYALAFAVLRNLQVASDRPLWILQFAALLAATFFYVAALRLLRFSEYAQTIAYFSTSLKRLRRSVRTRNAEGARSLGNDSARRFP